MSSYSLPEKVFHSFLSLGRRNFSSREGGKKRRGKNLSFNCFCPPAPKSSLGRPPLFPSASELGTNSFFIRSQRGKVLPGKRRRQKKIRPERKKESIKFLGAGRKGPLCGTNLELVDRQGRPAAPPILPPKKIPEPYIRILKCMKFEDIFILPPLFFLPGKPTMSKRRGRKDGKRKGEKGVLDRKLRWKKEKKRRRRRLCRRLHHKLSSRISRRRKGQKT